MKKFMFSLDSLLEIKKTLKEKAQAEYADAHAVLEKAECEKVRLDKIFEDESEKFEAKVKKGITVGDIQANMIYFDQLQVMIRNALKDVNRAQEDANRKQMILIELFKEIKVLEKLRQKQYLTYLLEEGKKETNASEDILSFNITGQTADYGSSGTAS